MGKKDKTYIELARTYYKGYSDWIKENMDSMFSLPQKDEDGNVEIDISQSSLKKLIIDVFGKEEVVGKTHSLSADNIGRIHVFGAYPRLLWSKSEIYKPLFLFTGEIFDDCIRCIKKKGKTIEKDDLKRDFPIISEYWISKLPAKTDKKYYIPPCWKRNYQLKPNLAKDFIPKIKCKAESKFNIYTYLDILILSRLRQHSFALIRDDMVSTPSLGHDNKVEKYNFSELDNENSEKNVTYIAYQARRSVTEIRKTKVKDPNNKQKESIPDNKQKESIEEYLRMFEFKQWFNAYFWNDLKDVSKVLYRGKKSNHDIVEALDKCTINQVNSKNWMDGLLNNINEFHLFGLNTAATTFLDYTEKADEKYGVGIINYRNTIGQFLISFEYEKEPADDFKTEYYEKRDWINEINQESKETVSKLLAYSSIVNDADARWINGKKIENVFPNKMKEALIRDENIIYTSKNLDSLDLLLNSKKSKDYDTKLDRAVLLYFRRIILQEDAPEQIALAAMGDIWREVFELVINPHYPEYERVQQLLSKTKDYRDHLTHSLQVFLMGLRIIESCFKNEAINPNRLAERLYKCLPTQYRSDIITRIPSGNNRRTLKIKNFKYKFRYKKTDIDDLAKFEKNMLIFQWTLASLMHDYAIPVEKAGSLISHLLSNFSNPASKSKVNSAFVSDSINEYEDTYFTLLYHLFSNTETGRIDFGTLRLPILSESVYKMLTQDHGFLGALYLFNVMFDQKPKSTDGPQWWELKEDLVGFINKTLLSKVNFVREDRNTKDREKREKDKKEKEIEINKFLSEAMIIEVIDSVARHNMFIKERRFFKENDYLYKMTELFSGPHSVHDNPIVSLLMLCDTLCDWGRIVQPDALKRHEDAERSQSSEMEIVRPECIVTGIQRKDNGKVLINVNYSWRLPHPYDTARHICLKKMYVNIARDMFPYTPGFKIWSGCKECKIDIEKITDAGLVEKCAAVKTWIIRFWDMIAGKESSNNRITFPALYDDLFNNKIELKITYHDESIPGLENLNLKPL